MTTSSPTSAHAATSAASASASASAASAAPIYDGVFAIDKPSGITSAAVVRECVDAFTSSTYFAPHLAEAQRALDRESKNQQQRRRKRTRHAAVKVGHGGTLDPNATGCLVIGVGKGTKQLQSFIESRKRYDAVVLFGVATDTYDLDGKVLAKAEYGHVTREKVEEALGQFRGDLQQRPPIFSALKMDGKKLYEYARLGKEPPREIALRPAKVYQLEMTDWLEPGSHEYRFPTAKATEDEIAAGYKILNLEKTKVEETSSAAEPGSKRKRSLSPSNATPNKESKLDSDAQGEIKEQESSADTLSLKIMSDAADSSVVENPPAAKLSMDVGSGFYVRSLCHDLGQAVGSLGLMASLVRTQQGPFSLDKSVLAYEDLKAGEDVWKPKIQEAFEAWSKHIALSKPGSSSAAVDAESDAIKSPKKDG